MGPNVWHQTIAAEGRLTLCPDERTVRKCVRLLAGALRDLALLFSIVDDHLHQAPTGTRDDARAIGRHASLALRNHVAAPLDPTRTKPVESRSHLRNLVDYFLRQATHHDLPVHPALWSGSCFLDLIGARVIEGLTLQLHGWLPRLRLREVFPTVGLPAEKIEPLGNEMLRKLGAFRIAEAAAAAVAVGPGLIGKGRPTVLARTSAAAIAIESGVSRRDIADALEITTRALRRLLDRVASPSVCKAIRMRLALEEAVGPSGPSV